MGLEPTRAVVLLVVVALVVPMASLWKLAFSSSGSDDKSAQEGEPPKCKQKAEAGQAGGEHGAGENATTKTMQTDRYQHDLQQAIAMRGENPRLFASKQTTHVSETDSIMEDIDLGFKGLDEADAFRNAGDLEQALKLYELSLELLLRVLKRTRTAETQSPLVTLETEPIEARVAVALSDAEHVKVTLGRRHNDSKSRPPASQTPRPESKSLRSLSNALSSTLQKGSVGHSSLQHSPSVDRRPQAKIPQLNDELSRLIMSDFLVDAKSLHRTTWDDISGLERVKQTLQESAILPLMRPDLFSGLRKPKNVLLYGPPGTGKTMLVRAVAQESGSSLFCVTAAAVTSKWMGEAEKLVRALFAVARQVAPSLIFIDEVDSLLSARKSDGEHEASRRLKTEFMVQMDGLSKVDADDQSRSLLLVLACTNCPWDVDPAVLRRFPRRLFVPLPDEAARRGLLSSLLKKAGRHSLTSGQISSLARRLEGYSCADVSAIASEASFGPLRSVGGLDAIRKVSAKDIRPICMSDFEVAMAQATKSVTPSQIERYDEWKREVTA